MKEYPEIFDESDQASIVGSMFYMHMRDTPGHNGKPDPECPFCKGFIIDNRPIEDRVYPLESYKFVIIDLNEK